MAGISSILSIGQSALSATQTCLQVTSNNIANVDTDGYSRQSVVLKDGYYVSGSPGQLGSGVIAQEVVRAHDSFIEAQYLQKLSARDRFQALYNGLSSVQNLVNESNTKGLNSSLSTFFDDWGDLTTYPDSTATRQTMLDDTETLLSLYRSMADSMNQMEDEINEAIAADVDTVNALAKDIADINAQINKTEVEGQNIPNGLYDLRDQKIRDLSSLVDVNVIDNGKGNVTVNTNAGQTVVDGMSAYEFTFEPGKTVRQMTQASKTAGSDAQAYYDGKDSSEYTLEVVSGGTVGAGATFRVSLDGGKSWVKDDNGNDAVYAADDNTAKVRVGNLDIWFGTESDPDTTTASTTLLAGDKFTLVPKKALYWYTTAGTPVNVTPQQYADGKDNAARLTGGALAGAFLFRDESLGDYQNTLDAMANTMVWEVNRIHSQGSGLTAFNSVQGTYSVADPNVALGDPTSGLTFSSRLASGAAMLYAYDSAGTLQASGSITVDPDADSLQDIVDKINDVANPVSAYLTASIVNNQLVVSGAATTSSFRFGDDSSGLYAALGVNTLLAGSSAEDVSVNAVATNNTDYVCAGHVGLNGLLATGDNTTALAMTALENKNVDFYVVGKGTDSQTLTQYYSSLVSDVGADTASASYQLSYQGALASQLEEQQLAVSAVSLDEELTNLIRFQHSYQAAAKLISTADSLFETILGLKN